MRSEAASQDNGLSVLVAAVRVKARAADFSVKEKDEASPLNRFQGSSLNAFILRFAGV